MTRSERVAHAVIALREARAADSVVAADGATLARSEGFASYNDAEQAAQRVREAATSARFERHGIGASPVDLIARRDAARDDADAERWLDEGGSFSSEAVTQ
jgi:uncharacterized protein YegP (UPF0339 family)